MTVFGLKRESKKKKCYVFSSKGNYLCKTPEDNKTNLKCVGRWFSGLLDDVVFGSPEFNYSATLVHAQLVCLPPAGILNLVSPEKPQWKWPITYTLRIHAALLILLTKFAKRFRRKLH